MNAIGIDVSKGKSTVAVLRPFGEVVAEPFEIIHCDSDFSKLVAFIRKLHGESKVVMEATGAYHEPLARYLHSNGIFVSVVNAILIHDYSGNTLRKAKTDKKDALKISAYTLDRWTELREYTPAEDLRYTLKLLNRQYIQNTKIQTMQKNNLISLTDMTFPNVNKLFSSPKRTSDGHEKWVDFVMKFPHTECVSRLSLSAFRLKYESWCRKNGYNYSSEKAEEIHTFARSYVTVIPYSESISTVVQSAVAALNNILEINHTLRTEMDRIASELPEYETVNEMFGVGKVLAPQLMAEIGDTRRFHGRKAITAFAGLDSAPYQSRQVDIKSCHISKKGSAELRKTLYQIISVYIQNAPSDEPVFQFLDKKRSEGKPFKVYMIAAANKFLRIYYARVNQVLNVR